jgi:hypothetical protein
MRNKKKEERVLHEGDVMMEFQVIGIGLLTLFFGAMVSARPIARR